MLPALHRGLMEVHNDWPLPASSGPSVVPSKFLQRGRTHYVQLISRMKSTKGLRVSGVRAEGAIAYLILPLGLGVNISRHLPKST